MQHRVLTRCIRKRQRSGMHFAQCLSRWSHSGSAVLNPPLLPPLLSLPCSPVPLLLIVLEVQGGSISTGTLSTAAPVKHKVKGRRESIGRLIIPCVSNKEKKTDPVWAPEINQRTTPLWLNKATRWVAKTPCCCLIWSICLPCFSLLSCPGE